MPEKRCKGTIFSPISNHHATSFTRVRIIIGHFLLVKINGKTTLINSKTGTPLLDDAIDGVDNTLNCAGIVIRKEGKAALFSNSGKQLTNFREGDFAWKWADIGNHCPLGYLFREIIDKASGQSWIEPE